jgi:Flp pilus assembly protein TadD
VSDAGRAPLLAALLAFVVWVPSLGGGFLYDDLHNVVHNRAIRDPHLIGAALRFEPARPLLGLGWALNYAVGGTRPFSYHLVNVALHAANAGFVAWLFLWIAERSGRRQPAATALFGAALFAVTPMAAETVGYVSSRSTALAALFMLASLRLALGPLAAGRTCYPALACFVLALATKEEAVALPLLLLLLDYFFVAGRSGAALARRAGLHAPFLVLPLLGLGARRLATGAWLPAPALDRAQYLLTQAACFPLYLGRALVPLDPALYRGQSPATWPPDLSTSAGLVASLALAAFALAGRKRWADASFAILWLAAALLPSSSLVALKEMAVDHRAYLGGAGVLYLVAAWLWSPGRTPFAVALVALLAARSVQYQAVLAEPPRAWEDAAARAPLSSEARRFLAEAYADAGDPRAEDALRAAITLAPSDPRNWSNLGTFYIETRRFEEAEAPLRNAAELAPHDARVRDNLGGLLEALGREHDALREYEAAAEGRPALAQPRIRLAELLLKRGQRERAASLAGQAAALELDQEDARRLSELLAQLAR